MQLGIRASDLPISRRPVVPTELQPSMQTSLSTFTSKVKVTSQANLFHHQILMFKLAPYIKWKGLQVNIDHFDFVYVWPCLYSAVTLSPALRDSEGPSAWCVSALGLRESPFRPFNTGFRQTLCRMNRTIQSCTKLCVSCLPATANLSAALAWSGPNGSSQVWWAL